MTKAWHLRQDGKYFPVQVHIYPMQDDDLSSEAEVASFIISTESKDTKLAEYVIDAWVALQIEDTVDYDADMEAINEAIKECLEALPYKFAYPLKTDEIINIHNKQNNYYDVDTLYEFTDLVRANLIDIQERISQSFNQQFCRVRFGGKYNSEAGNSGIWFRIASANFNWADTIYVFTSDMKNRLGIETITICRDPESDNGYGYNGEDYFYTAKDGAIYYQMPVDEFLREEHEHSQVFSASQIDFNRGVLASIRQLLSSGETLESIQNILASSDLAVPRNSWSYLVKKEQSRCVEGSEWSDNLNTRTGYKIGKVEQMILSEFPEIDNMDIDCKPRANTKGRMVGFEMIFTLESEIEAIDHLAISIASNKPLGDVLAESLVRMFRVEYTDYLKFQNISVE